MFCVNKIYRIAVIATIALFFAWLVIMLGAYTRLTHAGLGCPDWPGCYGHLMPQTQIEPVKAWTEMIHRYAAGTLGCLIVFFALMSFRLPAYLRIVPGLLVICLIFQALLGMWTVTMKLLPLVVMGHLLGGMTILSLLSYWIGQLELSTYISKQQNLYKNPINSKWQWAVLIGVIVLFCQIALGGWVSANYAGIACIGFPKCNGYWMPPLHWEVASFQWVHRVGAWVTAIYLVTLMGLLRIYLPNSRLRCWIYGILLLVLLQFMLGIINVVYMLPLGVAVLHNGVAALLLASMVGLWYRITH